MLGDHTTGERVFNAFLAISSLGNVIIMTFTAARMKQEIAKEGFLPFARFFAQDYDLSLGRLLRWLRGRGYLTSILRMKWLAPETHQVTLFRIIATMRFPTANPLKRRKPPLGPSSCTSRRA